MPSRPVGDLMIDSLSSRFCYWQGEHGGRYLFSQIKTDDIYSFSECVLLIATPQDDHPKVHWIGEICDLTPMALRDIAPQDLAHISVYVHLLAGSKKERQRVVADLSDVADHLACRLSA